MQLKYADTPTSVDRLPNPPPTGKIVVVTRFPGNVGLVERWSSDNLTDATDGFGDSPTRPGGEAPAGRAARAAFPPSNEVSENWRAKRR